MDGSIPPEMLDTTTTGLPESARARTAAAATSENWAICSSAILEGMSCETISRSTAGSRARMLRLAG